MSLVRCAPCVFGCLFVIAALPISGASASQVVYETDFTDDPDPARWSVVESQPAATKKPADPKTPTTPAAPQPIPVSTTPKNPTRFLGECCNTTVRLTLTNLPAHTRLRLRFNLYIIRTWDGNIRGKPGTNFHNLGPDRFFCSITGDRSLLATTFANNDGEDYEFRQQFPGILPGELFPPRTGSAANRTLGYTSPKNADDTTYHFDFVIPHTADNVQFNFTGDGLQGVADESWGLDDVAVETLDDADVPPMSDERFEEIWQTLAGTDGTACWPAVWELAAQGDRVLDRIEQALSKDQPPDRSAESKLVQKHLAALQGTDPAAFLEARKQLKELAPNHADELRDALQKTNSPLLRIELSRILQQAPSNPFADPLVCRRFRAIAAMRLIGGDRARKICERLETLLPPPSPPPEGADDAPAK